MLTKKYFIEHTGDEQITDKEFAELRTIYRASGVRKDVFCEEYRLTGMRVARRLASNLLIERAYLKRELIKAQKAIGQYKRPRPGEVKYIPLVADKATIYSEYENNLE